jgi:hypothetical protein
MSDMRFTSMRAVSLAVIALAVLSPGCLPASAQAASAIECHISSAVADGMLRLNAIANGRTQASGEYLFEVAKISESGTSQNVQSGAFVVDADQETILTTVLLDGTAVGHYKARLTLISTSGRISCVSP